AGPRSPSPSACAAAAWSPSWRKLLTAGARDIAASLLDPGKVLVTVPRREPTRLVELLGRPRWRHEQHRGADGHRGRLQQRQPRVLGVVRDVSEVPGELHEQ